VGTIVVNPVQPGTADSILYTSAVNGATIGHVFATNVTGGPVTLTLTIHRAISGNVETIANALNIGASTMQDVLNDVLLALGELVFFTGDTLHASASAAASVTVTATT
jgi:hypothetical protein